MSAENDDNDRKGLAWLPLLVSAAVVALLAIALITSGNDSSSSADGAAETPAATTTTAGTGDATATAPASTTAPEDTTSTTEDAAIPEEVQSDPVVQRLARGRTLPFTAGPWRKEAWRDAVYTRLRPATQQRAEKVAEDGGFGILIQ